MTENNLWHPKEEMPKPRGSFNRIILDSGVFIGIDHQIMIDKIAYQNYWVELIEIYGFKTWCYLDDLLSIEQQLQAKEEEIEGLKADLEDMQKSEAEKEEQDYKYILKMLEDRLLKANNF